MPMYTVKIALVAILLFCLAGPVKAQEYRSGMKVPPVELYGSLLKLAEREDYAKITKSLPFLDAIFSEEKEKFGVDVEGDIKASLNEKGNGAAISAIRQAIFYDIKDIFFVIKDRGNAESSSTLKKWLMMANLDYKLLSRPIKERSFKTNQEIERFFFSALSSLNTEVSPLAADKREKKVDMAALEELLTGIEEQIFAAFPEFKQSK